MPYRTIQSLYDAIFPKGRDRCYWKSLYLRALDDDAISDIVAHLAKRPSEMTFASIWAFGGAVQRVPAAATAFGDRRAPYMLSLDAIWSRRPMMPPTSTGCAPPGRTCSATAPVGCI